MADILAVLKAIPALIGLFKEILGFIKHLAGDDIEGFLKRSGEAFAMLTVAKTDEEKANAARAIQSLIRRT